MEKMGGIVSRLCSFGERPIRRPPPPPLGCQNEVVVCESHIGIPKNISLCIRRRRLNVVLEGIISVGKSELLNHCAEKHHGLFNIFPEPTETWKAYGPTKVNMLDRFYRSPSTQAFAFQCMILQSRLHAFDEIETSSPASSLSIRMRLFERSLNSTYF